MESIQEATPSLLSMAAPFIIRSLLLLMEQGGQGGMDNIPLSSKFLAFLVSLNYDHY